MDTNLCEQLCRTGGGVGEVMVCLIVLGRWLWAEWNRRKLSGEKTVLVEQKAELVGQVKQLSLRPPAMQPGDVDVVITGLDDADKPAANGLPPPPPIETPPTSKS